MSAIRAITVAGVRVIATNAQLPGWLAPWSSSDRGADLCATVREGTPLAAPGPCARFGAGSPALEVSFVSGRFHLVTREPGGSVIRSASFDPATGDVEIVLPSGRAGDPFDRGLLEWLTLRGLAARRGFVLSACGVVEDGRALVFAGGAGSGRASVARLLRNHTRVRVISDDYVAIHESSGLGFVATAWPWPEQGVYRARGTGALQACHLIRRESVLVAEPMVGSRAHDDLRGLVVSASGDPESGGEVERTLQRCTERVPIVRLGFPADHRLARYVGGEVTRPRPADPPTPEFTRP